MADLPERQMIQLSLIKFHVHCINSSRAQYTPKISPPIFPEYSTLPLQTKLSDIKSPRSISNHYLFQEKLLKGFVLLNVTFHVHFVRASSHVNSLKTRKYDFKLS